MEACSKHSEQSLQIEDVPGLLNVNKVKPKTPKDNVRVTQVHGTMEGKKILEKSSRNQMRQAGERKSQRRCEIGTSGEDRCFPQV